MMQVVLSKSEESGFELLLPDGLGVPTVESLVVAHFERFPAQAVATAKARLTAHGIPLPH